MGDESERLKKRTLRFALDVCGVIKQLPIEEPGPTVRRQLARAATGVAFNYRSTCRARSHTEFTARIGVVAEEADESEGWLEFIDDAQLIADRLKRLRAESDELVAIFSASVGIAREKELQAKTKRPRRSR